MWVIYPLLFLETVMVAFFEPARNAVIPNVVGEDDVIVANTLASATWSFDLAIGSMLGGIVAAWLGRDAVFVINSLSFAASALLISRMSFVESHADAANRHAEDQSAGWSSMRAGFRYIVRDPKLAALVSLKGGMSIVGTSWVLFPVMAMRVFTLPISGLTPERAALFGMSLLMGARGVGALMGPLVASRWTGQHQPSLRMAVLLGFVVGGIGYIALGNVRSIWVAMAVIVVAHCGTSTVWVFSTTLLTPEYRGPIFGTSLRRGAGDFDARSGRSELDRRAGHRWGSFSAHGRRGNGCRDVPSCSHVGACVATVASRNKRVNSTLRWQSI